MCLPEAAGEMAGEAHVHGDVVASDNHLLHGDLEIEPVSDIDTAAADSLKVLDPKRPIREADITTAGTGIYLHRQKIAEAHTMFAE